MPEEQHRAPRAPTPSRMLIILLTLVLIISYIDRGNLATAGPLITGELGLSPSQFGTLLSAFYFAYATLMIPAGWLAERYGARPVLAVAVGIWTCATLATGFAGSFAVLLTLRVLLGIGESAVFPSCSKLIRAGVDEAHAGIANGVASFGYQIGPAIGTFAGGLLMSRHGWRATFWVFGALSLAWLVPWSRVRVAEPTTRGGVGSALVPAFATILRQRALWGASIGNFGINYSFFFVLAWLPTYLVKERGFSIDEMAATAAPAYALSALSSVLSGFVIDRWIRGGRTANAIHKGLMTIGYTTGVVTTIGIAVLPRYGSIASLYLYEFFGGIAAPSIFAVAQAFAGPGATARWVGVQNLCGNLAGIVASLLTGVLIESTHSYVSAFTVAALANIVGFVGWVLVMPTVAPIRWPPRGGTPLSEHTQII
jgi:MFS family permease